MNLQAMKTQFESDFDLCVYLQNNQPQNDADMLFHWILNTNISPYNIFLDSADASSASSIEGLAGLYSLISHAINDDGELSFISVNGQPLIVRLIPQDFDNEQCFFDYITSFNSKFNSLEGQQNYKILDINVAEFIEMAKENHVAHIKACFISDAEIANSPEHIENIVNRYKKEHANIFTPDWTKEVIPYFES